MMLKNFEDSSKPTKILKYVLANFP